MNLLGLSPLAFALGAVGLAAALGAVHLLRIRLRQQTVDSLIFFEMLGAVERPRVFLGRPARWLSYLIALLALLALWTVFGEPVAKTQVPSRVILLDASGLGQGKTGESMRVIDAHLQTATQIVASSGLGPKGAVYAIGVATIPLLRAGEPHALLAERAARLSPTGPQLGWTQAIRTVAGTLREGDEIVTLGAPTYLPTDFDGHPILRGETSQATNLGLVGIALRDWPERTLVVEYVGTGECTIALTGDALPTGNDFSETQTLAEGSSKSCEFARIPDGSQSLHLSIHDSLTSASYTFDLAERRPHSIVVQGDRSGAITAAISADAALSLATTGSLATADSSAAAGSSATSGKAQAQVIDESADELSRGASNTELPTLRISLGDKPRPRRPRITAHCPLRLSFRDRARDAATSLTPIEGEAIWVEDGLSGAPLIAVRTLASGLPEIRVVSWLLDDPTHRDVPAILIGCLRMLTGVRGDRLVAAGEPLRARSLRSSAVHYTRDSVPLVAMPSGGTEYARLASGTWQAGSAVLTALPAAATAPAEEATSAKLATLSGSTDWVLWLLVLALLCISTDVWLYHRGRTP